MNLFESAVGGGGSSDSNSNSKTGGFQTVDTGVDAIKVGAYKPAIKKLQQLQTLPNSTTAKAMISAEEKANQIKASNFKLASLAISNLNTIRETARTLKIQMSYQTGVMDANLQIEGETAKYGIKAEEYGLGKQVLEAGYISYLTELKGGSEETSNLLSGW